jgi:T-complex protein 1 subunit gamma
MENNLKDAMSVARNIVFDSRILPGGGVTEMAVGKAIMDAAKTYEGVGQWPMRAVAAALEVIPRTLIDNCGGKTISVLTDLRAKHAGYANTVCCPWGVDGKEGQVAMMTDLQVYEPYLVKSQTIKTAIESACMILRIDDIVSGVTSAPQENEGAPPPEPET